ncbi:MAG TPA: hypothetical protein ENO05_11055 [Bacteroides sp.]|nr:hypothetical protein [Bacteroides sp.]
MTMTSVSALAEGGNTNSGILLSYSTVTIRRSTMEGSPALLSGLNGDAFVSQSTIIGTAFIGPGGTAVCYATDDGAGGELTPSCQ